MRSNAPQVPLVVLRTEANRSIGTGHLMECLSLADYIAARHRVRLCFVINNSATARDLVKRRKYKYVVVNKKGTEQAEASRDVRRLMTLAPQAVVFNLLERSSDYYRCFGTMNVPRVVILDHVRKQQVVADVVVNFNICQMDRCYPAKGTEYFLGPRYMVMDERILERRRTVRFRRRVKRVFVNSGGGDPYNLTPRICRVLRCLDETILLDVVTGRAYPEPERKRLLKEFCGSEDAVRLHHNVTPADMATLMARADVAVSAAGNTLYELCCLGIPTLVVSHHRAHDRVAQAFARHGLAINAGIGVQLTARRLTRLVKNMLVDGAVRQTLHRTARRTVRPEGCRLITQYLWRQFRATA